MENSIAKLANKYGIIPLKKYGQNFIYDQTLCDKIVKVSGLNNHDLVLEIGSGPAGLTRAILKKRPKKLTVIETDVRCIKLLQELSQNNDNLNIIHADALQVKLAEILKPNESVHIIANLPYNIGTKLLINWLYELKQITSMTIMLQKEVIDRITAKIDSKTYGRLSVICQLMCNVKKQFDVSPKAFYPEPKIWSSIITLTPKSDPPSLVLLKKIAEITNLAFSGRRKMIKSSLKNLTPNIESHLQEIGLTGTLRAENLSPENYLTLAKKL
ncbi:MAG: 16S rRNA (adenine(1518)-N(6)/adenine(1519)-N(6))-dimethyltransferase RsmA [Rickettsiaceae bacterium]|nr:16S rRNA (adenine(1518)-N(6)/adenine(1519)-N(6))-dimethyltransferase RsmA [Rickettsiaceae bacterium]